MFASKDGLILHVSPSECPGMRCACLCTHAVYVLFSSICSECAALQLVSPPAWPLRRQKEQESIVMNGQPNADWLELNGNVKLATDPFCFVCRKPHLNGKPEQNNTQPVTVNTSLFPFQFTPLCLTICGQRKARIWRAEVQQMNGGDYINGGVHCEGFKMDLREVYEQLSLTANLSWNKKHW